LTFGPQARYKPMPDTLKIIYDEINSGMQLAKCRQCGCMRETIAALTTDLQTAQSEGAKGLISQALQWARQMKTVRYACLGCEHCYPAVAQNALAAVFPEIEFTHALNCDFQVTAGAWPPVPGEYFVVDANAPVAVSTLASAFLPGQLASAKPSGLAIAGKTETENIGVDKIIKNTIANPAIRCLIVCGRESTGHNTGQALLALSANGVDVHGRVIGATGTRPVLRNVSAQEVEAFRRQVRVVDMVGCEDIEAIVARVSELSQEALAQPAACTREECRPRSQPTTPSIVLETVTLVQPDTPVVLDKAGYFVILPLPNRQTISVEHYGYDNTLLHTLEGKDARSLYKSIVARGWVSELSHAAYLGTELAKAELSLRYGFPYQQDGA
jgi:tetrahydromethanopterin S-methyltransferase subunit A